MTNLNAILRITLSDYVIFTGKCDLIIDYSFSNIKTDARRNKVKN